MSTLSVLNLDNSYPVTDAYHATNGAGTVRFIAADDEMRLDAVNRLQGDIQHKFVLMQAKVNELVLALNSNPALATFNSAPYTFVDGSHPFTAPVAGVSPTSAAHLTTKSYVDSFLGELQDVLDSNTLAVQELEQRMPKVVASAWTEHTWQPGVKQVLSFSMAPAIYNLNDILSISLLERLNVAQPTLANPTPTPIYVYKPLTGGTDYGFLAEEMWVNAASELKVLVPNAVFFSSGYPANVYGPLTSPQQRWFKAVATFGSAQSLMSSTVTYKSGKAAITSGATTVTVTFPQAFFSPPTRLEVNLLRPNSGAAVLSVAVDKTSITAEGFTVGISSAVPSTGYDLQWAAFL